jgi:hypothetical protein
VLLSRERVINNPSGTRSHQQVYDSLYQEGVTEIILKIQPIFGEFNRCLILPSVDISTLNDHNSWCRSLPKELQVPHSSRMKDEEEEEWGPAK